MSVDTVLAILSNDGVVEWIGLDATGMVVRGASNEEPSFTATAQPPRVIAVVPGQDVALHWVKLPPGLSEPQARAAARIAVSDLGVESAPAVHVAVGPEEAGTRCIAVVSAARMSEWMKRLGGYGLDPDALIPAPLLLVPPEQGWISYGLGALPSFRGPQAAFSVERDLAARIVSDALVVDLDDRAFEAGLIAAVSPLPVNLRQGSFAKRRRWALDGKRVRRMTILAVLILLLGIAVQMAAILRHTFAADAVERAAMGLAQAVGATPSGLDARLSHLGGGEAFTPLAAAMFDAVRATPNVQLGALGFDKVSGLHATVLADTPASIAAVQRKLLATGYGAQIGPVRTEGGQAAAELKVKVR